MMLAEHWDNSGAAQAYSFECLSRKICLLSSQHGVVGERFTEPTRLKSMSASLVHW